ncbi:RRM_1 domain-containing protein/PAM2 domain-containing protein/RRM_6 domain-containing protein [Cephalotus follicularis]|uniref:RRM_1 domain-containing protein/PAM2 domain-containing protein/RRM_6 domain-containing protein n=1 Tax=Cephalotus follicularis TaxID=3775 RepID=A0A1Q3AYR6_CEPFO|nr:RRM_1 domain-containing protein/PAM2 domain-containing protein/RRM_6 domain-containing protein [Cephalotus follicularis]
MAAVADISSEAAVAITNNSNRISDSKPKSESEFNVQKLVDMFTKLNPSAKEFFPSNYINYQHDHPLHLHKSNNQLSAAAESFFIAADKNSCYDDFANNRRRRNNFNQGRRRVNGRSFRAQREDSIRRTVYVSDIDQNITEERLAGLFSGCGQVVDCRVCGDPHSVLRFAFVEFADEHGARAALSLGGTMLGYYPVRVLPSKTAILPVNPTFLPRSEDEREMCSRTVYCTNIDKKVTQAAVKHFFESACGEVTRLRLLGDHVHSTRIAFVEFAMAESAIIALNCSGMVLGTQPVRVSPSKTPVRPRVTRATSL